MKLRSAIIAFLALGTGLYAADVRVGSNITDDTVWTSDNTYILDAQVYIVNDASLTIEPGTVVKGASLSGDAAALIVTRGSKLFAMGTSTDPIIFTAEADPLDGSLDASDTELWGGLIVLGSAPINSFNAGTAGDLSANPQVPTIDNVEGLVNSSDNDWTEYGGLDVDDNSGIIRYVSIRHGGSVIGGNNEINGLTMGGVGRGTIIEFVEVFANKDDGFEWFGGTVDARYLVAAFGNDDSFDYDLGWRGRGQFWFSIGATGKVANEEQDHAGEHDGTKDALVAGSDRGLGTIYNATYIGAGPSQNEGVFEVSDDAGVRYYNSIFMDFGHGVDVKTDALAGLTTDDGDGVNRVDFTNNIWFNLGATGDVVGGGDNAAAVTAFLTEAGKGNAVQDPMLGGVSRTADGGLDPVPAAGSPALTNPTKALPDDPWYIKADYQGAFGESNWLLGWTKLSQDGYIGGEVTRSKNTIFNTAVRTSLDVAQGELVAVGTVITGDAPRMVLIVAEGEGLADNNVSNPASATALQIFDNGELIEGGRIWTNWAASEEAPAIRAMAKYVGFGTFDNDTTSGMALLSLNPGAYSIAVTNPNNDGGEALISTTIVDQ